MARSIVREASPRRGALLRHPLLAVRSVLRAVEGLVDEAEASPIQTLIEAGRVTVGRETFHMPMVRTFWFDQETRLSIGSFDCIAKDVHIYLGGEHRPDWVTTFPLRSRHVARTGTEGWSRGDVVIGNDVWIADGTFILSGVTVGDGAVVGARSVLTKSVPPYAIVAGNPARLIRYRFDEPTREALLRIAWWDWPMENILAAVDKLCSPDLEAFVAEFDPATR